MSNWNKHQQAIVDQVIEDWEYLCQHEQIEWYFDARPYARPTRKQVHEGHVFSSDCTGTIKLIDCDWNGIKPFDGESSGYGNTRTFAQAAQMYHVQGGPSKWQPLDVILYKHHSGPFVGGSGEHATQILYKKGGVWQVGSHGMSSGPKIEPWNYRNDKALVIRPRIPLK
jgi:hypothetical protein